LAAIAGIESLEFAGGAVLTLTGTQFNNGLSATTSLLGFGGLTVNMDVSGFFVTKLFSIPGNVGVTVNGTTGTDIFKLGNAAHTVNAGDGIDQIKGGDLADIINGGADGDKINGAGGADIITGGAGNDVFKYAKATDSGVGAAADRITDYAVGADKLNFARIDTNAAIAGDQGFAFIGNGTFSNTGRH
jgi:serralysin